ncbi:MAG: hypothetical protein IT338_06465 [Thermomicrobiales bacterium]|nr:hypothetical protein [Thermomicrobiales bacterium]
MGREFFRIVRNSRPDPADFRPVGATGRPLRFPEHRREFEEGISVYDDFEHACEMARKHRFRHGAYILRIVLPDDGSVEFRQTFAPHHYTMYGTPEQILPYADDVAVGIPGVPGD